MIEASREASGEMDSIDALHRMVSELKKAKRRLLSNMFLGEKEVESLIKNKHVYYTYMPCRYLNLWYSERDFVRLYFYIVDMDSYKAINEEKIICELYFPGLNANNALLEKVFEDRGFKVYASYHKWIARNIQPKRPKGNMGYRIVCGQPEGFAEAVNLNFDIYSDHVPVKSDMEAYLRQNRLYALSDGSNMLAGGLIVAVNGRIQTEEYVFVRKECRGKGLALFLHNFWYESQKEQDILYVAWIRDDNVASIGLHMGLGYLRQDAYKLTLQKGIYL